MIQFLRGGVGLASRGQAEGEGTLLPPTHAPWPAASAERTSSPYWKLLHRHPSQRHWLSPT